MTRFQSRFKKISGALLGALALAPLANIPAALADVFMFQSPSGNIVCSVGLGPSSSDIACTIVQRQDPPAAPRPPWCTADWGHSFLMYDRGPVQMLCEPLNRRSVNVEIAEYGVTGTFGGFRCHSARTGLECRNLDGHGFFLSRARQSIF